MGTSRLANSPTAPSPPTAFRVTVNERRVLGPAPPYRVDTGRLPRPRTELQELEHRLVVLAAVEHQLHKLGAQQQAKRLRALGIVTAPRPRRAPAIHYRYQSG
jgi:hypothetical protein